MLNMNALYGGIEPVGTLQARSRQRHTNAAYETARNEQLQAVVGLIVSMALVLMFFGFWIAFPQQMWKEPALAVPASLLAIGAVVYMAYGFRRIHDHAQETIDRLTRPQQ